VTTESVLTLIQHIEDLSDLVISYQKDNSKDSLDSFAQKLEETGIFAGEQNMPGFQDVCFLLQDFLLETPDGSVYKATQQQQLVNWVDMAKDYIKQPDDDNADKILNIFRVECWPAPLTNTDTNFMKEMLVKSDDTSEASMAGEAAESESIVSEDASDNVPSDDSLCELSQALKEYQSDDSALGNIIKHIERVGSFAAETDLLGFQDVCMLLQQNLEDLMADNKKISDNQYHALQQWVTDAGTYINRPADNAIAVSLINFLTDNQWPSSLTEADTTVLKEMFGIVDDIEQIEDSSSDELDEKEIKLEAASLDNAMIESSEAAIVTVEACPVSPMLIDMLVDEIKNIEEDIEETATKITSASVDKKLRSDALSQLAVRFERFGNACQAAELAGLYQASEIIQINLALIAQEEATASQDQGKLIGSWPKSVNEYLLSLGGNGTSENIVDILSSDAWDKPLMAEVTSALIDLLNAPYSSEEETKETRQTEATVEDVSLELPTDISQELLDGLLQELPLQTEGFSSALQALIDGSGGSKEIEKAQRIAHTVKGAANTVGIRGIATLTHQLEDIFQFLNANNKLPSQALASSLIDASDCLEEMSESLISRGDAPANAQEVLQDILNWINQLENEGAEILDDDTAPVAASISSKEDGDVKPDEAEDEQAVVSTLRVPAPIIDDLIRLLGETIILTTQLQEKIKNSIFETGALIKQNEASHELINQLEQQVELRGISNVSQAVNQNEIFDSLELEQYNELHTITNQLAESTLDSVDLNREIKSELRELEESLIDQSRLHKEVQELVMRTRMVPIKTISPRLQRSVRQTCRATGKQAALHLSGTDTLIDSDILNNLVDPLIHMLRNALDHGIESRDERISKNKDPEGRIDLSFSSEGTEIVVRCKDDGATDTSFEKNNRYSIKYSIDIYHYIKYEW